MFDIIPSSDAINAALSCPTLFMACRLSNIIPTRARDNRFAVGFRMQASFGRTAMELAALLVRFKRRYTNVRIIDVLQRVRNIDGCAGGRELELDTRFMIRVDT